MSILNKTILITLFFAFGITINTYGNPGPPPPSPPVGFMEQTTTEMDFFTIQMIIMAFLFTVFFVLKRTVALSHRI